MRSHASPSHLVREEVCALLESGTAFARVRSLVVVRATGVHGEAVLVFEALTAHIAMVRQLVNVAALVPPQVRLKFEVLSAGGAGKRATIEVGESVTLEFVLPNEGLVAQLARVSSLEGRVVNQLDVSSEVAANVKLTTAVLAARTRWCRELEREGKRKGSVLGAGESRRRGGRTQR